MKKIAILISGSGTNLQAFIDSCTDGSLDAEIAVVISNRPNVYGLERAEHAGIKTEVIDHNAYDSRELFDTALSKCLDTYNCDAIVLAGFMRILTAEFVEHFPGKLFNIHPSLLPKYPGLNTHQRAIDNGDTEAGATVHFVVPELDAGPAIIQAKVKIDTNDNADDLAKKVLQQEHKIYPLALEWYLQGRLELTNKGTTLDGDLLPENGYQFKTSQS